MSTEVIAALLGVVVGLFGERLLRSFGRVWCEPSRWELRFVGTDPRGEAYGETDLSPEQASAVEYSAQLDLFNGKEIPVGLRDISIVFVCEANKELASKPLATTSGTFSMGRTTYATLYIINLEPRQWVTVPVHGRFSSPGDVRLISGWRRVEFVGHRQRRSLFEPRIFRRTIASRPPFPNPWKRETS